MYNEYSDYDPDWHDDDDYEDVVADWDCPKCESSNVIWIGGDTLVNVGGPLFSRVDFYCCNDCGHEFSDTESFS